MDAKITPQQTISELLSAWPAVIPLFIDRRMGCVGCSMAPFETLQDVSQIYGLDLNQFLAEINLVVEEEA